MVVHISIFVSLPGADSDGNFWNLVVLKACLLSVGKFHFPSGFLNPPRQVAYRYIAEFNVMHRR